MISILNNVRGPGGIFQSKQEKKNFQIRRSRFKDRPAHNILLTLMAKKWQNYGNTKMTNFSCEYSFPSGLITSWKAFTREKVVFINKNSDRPYASKPCSFRNVDITVPLGIWTSCLPKKQFCAREVINFEYLFSKPFRQPYICHWPIIVKLSDKHWYTLYQITKLWMRLHIKWHQIKFLLHFKCFPKNFAIG